MNPLPLPRSATDRFALVIDGLCKAVAARISARVMTGPFIVLIWQRLSRINQRVQALAARIRSGTLRVWPPRHRHAARRSQPPSLRLPRRFGWLLPLVPYQAAGYASQMRCLLEDPEMAALIAATPRMGRLLRPLCHLLRLPADLCAPRAAAPPPDVSPPDVSPPGVSPPDPAPLAAPAATPVLPARPPERAPPASRSDPVPGAGFFAPA